MLQPIRGTSRARAKARGYSTPAPVGGWNARDSVADMPEKDAVILDNWFPGTSRCRVRRGYAEHATGLSDPVETLMPYAAFSTEEMFAAAGSNIYDVSSSGAVGAAVVTSMTNARWQYVNFGTSADQFLIAVNGEDDARKYDGTSWGVINSGSSPAITGVSTSDLIHVNVFKSRLFFIEKASLSFWYLPVDSIGGTASEFSVAAECSLGGVLMAMGTWTRDGGNGIDDYAVFVTSEGEALLYQGTDPGTASNWSLIGKFYIGAPLGRRCMVKVGSELILLTVDGFIPMSRALQAARTNEQASLSFKIRDAVNEAVRSYQNNFGWQAILYPKGQWILYNVPTMENGEAEQYVANSTTGAWCRFTDMNANCWAVFQDDLYFGGNGTVYQADTGTADDGNDIVANVQQAFSYARSRGQLKLFTMMRPIFKADGTLTPAIEANTDYEDVLPTATPQFTQNQGSPWDTSAWNTSPWTRGPGIVKEWLSVNGTGYCVAIRIRSASQNIEVFWNATDWLFEPGGYL